MKENDLELKDFDYSDLTDEQRKKSEDWLEMSMRMKKIQDDVLTEYFSTPAIIRYNVLENLKTFTKEIATIEEFKIFLEEQLAKMKETYHNFTRIERIEYRFIKKIYRDVVEKQGKEFNLDEKLVYHYDESEIEVDSIQFKN